MAKEKFPVSEKLKIIDGTTLYKTDKWWSAVLVVEFFRRKQIALPLEQKRRRVEEETKVCGT